MNTTKQGKHERDGPVVGEINEMDCGLKEMKMKHDQ